MIEIKLNGSKMKDRETAHLYIKRKLSLPDYYGKNLDALWDLLSTDTSPKKIIIKNLNLFCKFLVQDEICNDQRLVEIATQMRFAIPKF